MLHVPGKTGQAVHTKKLVELVEILPTLAEAPVETCSEMSKETETFTSRIQLIDNPKWNTGNLLCSISEAKTGETSGRCPQSTCPTTYAQRMGATLSMSS